ncbi:MAG: VTT domain-containing protein [Gammaproteobacteria bacterium]|nr:VTT domain-containing protein [Gammaproteobacteria bacterium]
MGKPGLAARLTIFGVTILVLIAVYIILVRQGAIAFVEDTAALKEWIKEFGMAGPLILISLMAVAIVLSPIPSAPIALAAGAAYGHTEGTIYVVIGSGAGAVIAFFIARLLGVDVVRQWIGDGITKRLLDSQTALMGIVFVSRLLPFVSFDLVSYAAGITALSFWRFAVATLAGIVPASFLLAHFGSELVSGESQRVAITLLLLGGISLILFIVKRVSGARRD